MRLSCGSSRRRHRAAAKRSGRRPSWRRLCRHGSRHRLAGHRVRRPRRGDGSDRRHRRRHVAGARRGARNRTPAARHRESSPDRADARPVVDRPAAAPDCEATGVSPSSMPANAREGVLRRARALPLANNGSAPLTIPCTESPRRTGAGDLSVVPCLRDAATSRPGDL